MKMHSEVNFIDNSHKNFNPTIAEALRTAREFLEGLNMEKPGIDCEVFMRSMLAIRRAKLYAGLERNLSSQELENYNELIKRRSKREPVQYILGNQEFWSLDFFVNKNVLIPRPETEGLIEKVIARAKDKNINNEPLKILDIGTGCGNIAVSIAKELKSASIIATDISANALKVARINAERNGVAGRIIFVQGNLFTPFAKDLKFDFIVSNPPYIPSGQIDRLSPEVSKWEPRIALDGGEDGLCFYRKIIGEAFNCLCDDGFIMLEIGGDQAEGIKEIVRTHKEYSEVKINRDYSGKDRVAEIWIR